MNADERNKVAQGLDGLDKLTNDHLVHIRKFLKVLANNIRSRGSQGFQERQRQIRILHRAWDLRVAEPGRDIAECVREAHAFEEESKAALREIVDAEIAVTTE